MRYFNNALMLLFAALAISVAGGCQSQRTFHTPEEAITALDVAVKAENKKELQRIFGPNAEKLKSGDPEQDQDDAIIFARRLAAKHKLQQDDADHATILVGEDEWPFSVPLVKKGSSWRFDTDAGLEELTNRRIGRNELLTIAACRTLIDAQKEFFEGDPDKCGAKHYAGKMMSTEGKKDGLYWPAPGGVDPSPIGPVMAMAASRRDDKGERIPFNGYLFKPLTRQAASAPGGAMDYLKNGLLTEGWAVIAYPAEYGKTGITSFLCGKPGVVYQQDLGDDTAKEVEAIDSYDPSDGWEDVDPTATTQPTTAEAQDQPVREEASK